MVSLSTSFLSAVGIPSLIYFYSGNMSGEGVYSVGGISVVLSVGSTFVLDYVFSPYVSTLEKIPVRQCKDEEVQDCANKAGQQFMLKATTRNLLAFKVDTVFDPRTDVTVYKGVRPFGNFIVKDTKTLYIHPELIHDFALRELLFGEESLLDENNKAKVRKDDEDELF